MAELLAPIAARRGEAPALVDERGATSWRALDERVNRLVHALRARGVAHGGTVAVMSRNRREWLEVQLAALHTGVTLVPVNWHWVADELAYVLGDSGASLLFVEDEFADVAAKAAAQGHGVAVVVIGDPGAGIDAEPYEALLEGQPSDEPEGQSAVLPMFYTSGTTGFPKGVRQASALTVPSQLAAAGAGFGQLMGFPADGVTLLDGPIYHQAQWSFAILPLSSGSTVVTRKAFDAAGLLRLVDEHRVTNMHLVPTQFVRLLALPDDVRAAFDGSSLVTVYHGAAPCSLDVKRRMIEWWGPVLTEYYGGTESGMVSVVTADEWLRKPGSVGRILDYIELRVLDDDGNPVPLRTQGQLWTKDLRGNDFAYHNDEAKTEAAHRDGFTTLGDVGYLDEDGYLFLCDRKIDMIISGGVNIYPAEIEGVLVGHPAVVDAAVFGVPDDEFGEQVKAAVQLDTRYDETPELAAELIAYCRERIAGYKAPKSVDFLADLPRTPTGKLYKRLLRDRYWEGRERRI